MPTSVTTTSPIALVNHQPITSAPVLHQPGTPPNPPAPSGVSTTSTTVINTTSRKSAVGFYLGRIKKLMKSPDISTVILSTMIAIIFGVPTWLGLRLAAWTSKKDFYMLCLEKMDYERSADCTAALNTDGEYVQSSWLGSLDAITIIVISAAAVTILVAMLSICFPTGPRIVTSPLLAHTSSMDLEYTGHYHKDFDTASIGGQEQEVMMLLDNNANVNAQDGAYINGLYAASEKGQEQIVKMLLGKGANVNAQGGEYGNALQAASAGGHEQVVKMLLDKGAD
ncbi:ankyrin, partial [Macroventuria anomochaeta]